MFFSFDSKGCSLVLIQEICYVLKQLIQHSFCYCACFRWSINTIYVRFIESHFVISQSDVKYSKPEVQPAKTNVL